MKELASIAWSVVLVVLLNASPTLAENNEAPIDFPEAGSVAYHIQFRLLRGDTSGALALGRRSVAEAVPDLATLVAYLNALTTRLSWDDRYTALDDEIMETADRILWVAKPFCCVTKMMRWLIISVDLRTYLSVTFMLFVGDTCAPLPPRRAR